MGKNKKIGCLALLLFSPFASAMQPLDDQSLSGATAQDGLNIGVHVSKIDFNQIAIIDTDGFTNSSASLTSKAALVMAASPGGASAIGVDVVKTFNADGSIDYGTSALFNAAIDTDAGTGTNGAFANVALTLGSDVNGLRIRPFSVYLTPDQYDPGDSTKHAISTLVGSDYTQHSIFSTGTTLKSPNIKELLRVSNNIDIKFVSNNKPTMNFQLGASPQGHMVMFGGAIDSVCGTDSGCKMMLVADYTTAGNPSTAYGVGFDLQMTGKDANGFSLNGFYASIEGNAGSIPGALVFGNKTTSDKLNLSLNNIMLGDKNASNANNFNGLQNGSLGNIGAVGISATNLKMRVSGM
jgi:hypothetical protein